MKSVSYYNLPDGMADVYLRRELPIEKDEEGNDVYVYEEVNFKISADITEDNVKDNFDLLFEDAHALDVKEVSLGERNRADIDYVAIMTGVEL